jgi:diguanylate cyclase (GGDEF)-like protein
MAGAHGPQGESVLADRLANLDPFSHEATAAEIERLVALVEAQERAIRNYDAALARSKEIYERAWAAARLGFWECDLSTEALKWSAGTYDMFDIRRDTPLLRKQTLPSYPAESLAALETIRSRAIAQRKGFNLDARIITPAENNRWIRITATVECAGNHPVRLFGFKQDITEAQAKWDRVRYQAEFDPLTGLANRSQFQSKLFEICGTSAAARDAGTLLLVDLDGFKEVNDSHGHAVGDDCLKEAARRLARACSDAIIVARVGGDEFAVLVGPSAGAPVLLARQIIAAMNEPIHSGWHRFRIGVSIGLASLRYGSPRDALGRADAALYAAKSGGRNTYRWFDPRTMPKPAGRIG